MFNLLKSDCYRLVHGKMLWVILAVLLAMTAFTAAVVNFASVAFDNYTVSGSTGVSQVASEELELTGDTLNPVNESAPLLQADADEAEVDVELVEDTFDTFTKIDLGDKVVMSPTTLYGQSFAGGGELTVLVSLLVALFFASDFENHFARNLVMDARGRWRYYAEKLLLAALAAAAFLLVGMVATPICFALAGFTFANTESVGEIVLWTLMVWLTITVYAWIVAVAVWATHSKAAGIAVALVVGLGMAGGALMTAASLLGWKWPWLGELVHWLPYSNLTLLSTGDFWFALHYGAGLAANGTMSVPEGAIAGLSGAVQGFIVAALWLAACAALTFGVLRKKDV